MHLTWSEERKDGVCPFCGARLVLLVAPPQWVNANLMDGSDPMYGLDEEVSGHYCPECCRLLSLSLNTP